MSRVAIVGAGMGGLAAAVDLAARGHEVEVFEAGPRAGGKAGIAVVDGVEVDTGPSVLTLPGVFDALLRDAGTALDDVVTLRRPDPACRYRFADGRTVDVCPDPEATRRSVRETLGVRAAAELDAFLAYARDIWDAAAPSFVYGPAPTPWRVASLGLEGLRSVGAIDAFRTMDQGIARHVTHPELAWILRRFATYNGSDPARAPATLNCIAHVEVSLGVYGVEGGLYALVRGLVRTLEGLGGRVHTNTPVRRLVVERGRVVGVETEGATHRADAVVANADARHVLRELLPRGVRHGLDPDPEPSMSGWVGIVRARRHGDDLAGHTVLFPSDYDPEFRDVFDHDRPPRDPTVYVCAQERAHGRTGWADHEPLFVMANAPAEPARGARPEATWAPLREAVEARLRRSGVMRGDDSIVWTRSPRELAAAFPGSRGAIYGAASNDRFAAFRRPPNRVPRVRGLYLASGSAHPGGGLPLCALSGRAAAAAVLRDHPGCRRVA